MLRLTRILGALTAAVALTACSPLVLLNGFVPDDGYRRVENVAYGPGARHRLDIYQTASGSALSPVIVFLYGGSWKGGKRGDYQFVGEAFTRRGFTVVIPDYRVYPDARFPEFVADAARAVRWARDNVRSFGGDPGRLFVVGHSAGAHIGALLALDRRYLAAAGLRGGGICGFIGLAGPYAFDPLSIRSVRPIFEHLADPDEARPVTFATGGAPPALLFHGLDDTTVKPLNSRALADALARGGSPVSLEMLPGLGHVGLLLSLSYPFEHWAPVHKAIGDFVREHADCGAAPRQSRAANGPGGAGPGG